MHCLAQVLLQRQKQQRYSKGTPSLSLSMAVRGQSPLPHRRSCVVPCSAKPFFRRHIHQSTGKTYGDSHEESGHRPRWEKLATYAAECIPLYIAHASPRWTVANEIKPYQSYRKLFLKSARAQRPLPPNGRSTHKTSGHRKVRMPPRREPSLV